MTENSRGGLTEPLAGRVAVVVGGSRGIGFGVAGAMLSQGASVAIAARSTDEVERAANELSREGQVIGVTCDATRRPEVDELVAKTTAKFGRLDIIACCQGVYGDVAPFPEYSEENWDRTVAINLKASFLCSQAAAKAMLECGTDAGRIILISSVDGVMAEPSCVAYNASKAAIHGLTRGIAADLASEGITCNAIAPGWIATPMTRESVSREVFDLEAAFDLAPVGRIGVPADIGRTAAWLADPAASYVTGSIFVIDGGQTVVLQMPPADGG